MSKRHKEKSESAVNILIVLLILILCPVAIPICLLFAFLFYRLNIKAKYVVLPTSIVLFLLFLQRSVLQIFMNETINKANNVLHNIVSKQVNLLNIIVYKYSVQSWMIIVLISIIVAGYYLYQLQKRKKYNHAGIKALEASVDEIQHEEKIKGATTGTYLGKDKNGKKVFCEDTAKHVFCSGTTGSGKTVALSNFIHRAMTQNYGLVLIDGKGDTSETSMLSITKKLCEQYNRKLYVIDMNAPKQSAKYNPFSGNETVIKDMLINLSQWSEEHYKLNTERYLQRLIKMLKLNTPELSLELITDFVSTDNFKMLSTKLVADDKITKQEHMKNLEIIKASASISESANARFASLLESSVGEIFKVNGVDIYKALKEHAVIIFVLDPLLYPETAGALGRLVLIDAKKAVSKLYNKAPNRSFFLFDEINVYASTALVDLVNKSRSANVTCILATQSLADLETVAGEAFKEQVIENCNNYLILRQNSFKSAEEWSKTIGTVERMKMTYQIGAEESMGKGSARMTHEFIIHPDTIKSQKTGEGVFVSKDFSIVRQVHINKPI